MGRDLKGLDMSGSVLGETERRGEGRGGRDTLPSMGELGAAGVLPGLVAGTGFKPFSFNSCELRKRT